MMNSRAIRQHRRCFAALVAGQSGFKWAGLRYAWKPPKDAACDVLYLLASAAELDPWSAMREKLWIWWLITLL